MNHNLKNIKRARAFTLIELMVVILILAILAALIVPKVVSRQDDAKRSKAASDITTLSNAVQQFRLDCDRYDRRGISRIAASSVGCE